MKNWRRLFAIGTPFSKMSIVKKLTVGYFIIIFIPVICFGFYNYNQMYDTMITDYAYGRQQIIEQSYSTLKMDLLQMESKYELFQYNNNVIKYLEGQFQTDLDYAYFYLMQIKPLLSYALYGNPHIQDVRLFTENESVFKVLEKIMDWNTIPDEHKKDLVDLLPGKGVWIYDLTDSYEWSIVYYQNLYAQYFTKKVGVLEIQVNDQLLENFLNTLSNEGRSEVHLLPKNMNGHSSLDDELLQRIADQATGFFFLDNKRLIVNHLFIDELDVIVAVISHAEDVFTNKTERQTVLILTIAGLLVILSMIYYMIASSITKRILRLARHMRNVGEDNFRMIHDRQDQDEIGYLTSTYNLMLQRIDELVNKVQRSELLRKEAAYKVLQAQVKPHFLYNTLETIRMLAEQNEDYEVAEITFSFGQLMRYSQLNRNEDVTLSDEIKYINHYMKIHKMRLGPRLDYTFDIKLNTKRIPCPQFILQPLVENCIVHGLSLNKPFQINIKIFEDEHYVYVEISDNGVGIPYERLQLVRKILDNSMPIRQFSTGEGGQGLYNVSERIKAFYGEDSQMFVESEEGVGTTFKLNLNKKGMFKHVEAVSS